MGNLSFFLKQNVEQEENVKYVASNRFKDEKGNPVEWEIKSITPEEDDAIRKACTKRVPIVGGRKGEYTKDVDSSKYMAAVVTKCVVYPNLNDKELQDSYGVMGAELLVKTMLKPGEYIDLVNKVQEVNGYNVTQEDLVEEAKN